MENPSSVRGIPVSLTLYDVLGYITPGGSLLLAVFLFETGARYRPVTAPPIPPGMMHTPFLTAMTLIHGRLIQGDWIVATLFGLSLLGAAYVAGHIVASISSLLIDRILVYKGYGYPYSHLLNIEKDREKARSESGAFYRGMVFWVNFYLVLRYLSFFGLTIPLRDAHISLALAANIAGWVVVLVTGLKLLIGIESSRTIGSWLRGRRYLRPLSIGIRWFIKNIFAIPYDLVSNMLAGMLDTRRSFSESVLRKYREQFQRRFRLDPDDVGTNNFWLSYCFVTERSKSFAGMISNWLALYGFARNLASSFYVAFLYAVTWIWLQPGLRSKPSGYPETVLFLIPLILLALAVMMLIRYYYLYVCYFTKFIFRAFVYLEDTPRDSYAAG